MNHMRLFSATECCDQVQTAFVLNGV